jgi:hypothetical protein
VGGEGRTRRHATQQRRHRARAEEIGALIPAPICERDGGGIGADLFQERPDRLQPFVEGPLTFLDREEENSRTTPATMVAATGFDGDAS